MKSAVRERDGHACTKCNMTEAEHRELFGTDLHVHRLLPGSVYTLDGCVTLCMPCHGPEPRLGAHEMDLAAGKTGAQKRASCKLARIRIRLAVAGE